MGKRQLCHSTILREQRVLPQEVIDDGSPHPEGTGGKRIAFIVPAHVEPAQELLDADMAAVVQSVLRDGQAKT